MKLLRKGIAKDKSFIRLTFECSNGIDTYYRDYLIKEEYNIFVGYGCYIRTPDFSITIQGIKYNCFKVDGKTIKIPYKNGREYDGVCYIAKEDK